MDWGSCLAGGEDKVATLRCVPIVFMNVINALLVFVGAVTVIFIIIGGIKILTSSGDPKQVTGARQTITYAILGLVLVLLSFLIVNIIASVTGVSCIRGMSITACG